MKARIKVAKGGTFNMGNFESFRYDIGLEIEEEIDQYSDVDAIYDRLRNWVNEKFSGTVKSVKDRK